MLKKFCALALFLLVGCSDLNATKDLVTKFNENELLVVRLRDMSSQDATENNCFVVGAGRIDEYFDRNNAWVYPYEYNKTYALSEVLKATGLARERYENYVAMLASLSAEQVIYCKRSPSRSEFKVLVSSKGFCERTISWSSEPPETDGRQSGGDFHDISLLPNGWYGEIKCS